MHEVVVTRKGQTTIPVKLRIKHGIREGSRLVAVDTEEGILFRKALTLADLAGSASAKSSPKKMKSILDKSRSDDLRVSEIQDSSSNIFTRKT